MRRNAAMRTANDLNWRSESGNSSPRHVQNELLFKTQG
jgi:hypothetical protein